MKLPNANKTARSVALTLILSACSSPMLRVTDGTNYKSFVQDRSGGPSGADFTALRFRPETCQGENLEPETQKLDANHLIRFLERQQLSVRVERPRADLIYLVLSGVGTANEVRLRVAILANASLAGEELHGAMLQHGQGSWGIHRSNLAVLGPIGSAEDDLAFAGKYKLACWGMFSMAGRDDTIAVPGAYREL
jgi:hypothetical protein